MFPRISKSTKKSKIYEYLVLSESVHVKGKGSTTRNIANLGNIKKFKQGDIENLIDGLIRLFKIEKYSLSDQVEILESLEHGSIIFWQKIWNSMGLSREIKKLTKGNNRRITIDVEKYVEIMVINRCVDPLSKLGVTRWFERTCYKATKGFGDLNLHVEYFYRSMDYLTAIKDELELALYKRLKTLFSINVKLTFYDITSTFFYTKNCAIGKNGHSRDKRPDLEQIVIGVVTSYEGFPIKHYVFEGNTKDEKTVMEVVKNLSREYNIEETTFVGDRGMITKLNLSTIEKEGFDHIMGAKVRQSEIYDMILDNKVLETIRYQDYKGLKIREWKVLIKDFLLWKTKKILTESGVNINKEDVQIIKDFICSLSKEDEVVIAITKNALANVTTDIKALRRINYLIRKYKGQYENSIRSIICLNEERKLISKQRREIKISSISESLSDLFEKVKKSDDAVTIEQKLSKLFEGYKRRYKKFFSFLRDSKNKAIGFQLNNETKLEEEVLDGVFVLRTSRLDLEAGKVVDSYKNLKEVEMLFDDLKHFVDIRPFRHWLEMRVRSHVAINILSLLLKRIFEISHLKGKAIMHPLEEISKSKLVRYQVKFSEKENRHSTFLKVTQTTPAQKEVFKLVGIRNPMSLENYIW